MAKKKTHKGLAKRVRVSANGKVKHRRANTGHLMSGKPGKRTRKLRQPAVLPEREAKRIREALSA